MKEVMALRTLVAGVEIQRPEPASVDLAALGITEADLPRAMTAEELVALQRGDAMKRLMAMTSGGSRAAPVAATTGAGDGARNDALAKLLDDPVVRERLAAVAKQLGLPPEDLDPMLRNPALRQLLEKMLAESGKTPADSSLNGVPRVETTTQPPRHTSTPATRDSRVTGIVDLDTDPRFASAFHSSTKKSESSRLSS